jgi:hypothetical protein
MITNEIAHLQKLFELFKRWYVPYRKFTNFVTLV